jgi:hypothetical protein
MNTFVKLIISLVLLIGLTNSTLLPIDQEISGILTDLVKNINDSDIIEAGKKIESIIETFQGIGSGKLLQNSMSLFLADNEEEFKNNDPCLQILEALVADAKTMLSNVFHDLNKVKEALDDFMNQIKNIKNVCLPDLLNKPETIN